MKEIQQGETELQEDSDGLSLKSMDDDQQPDVGKPAEQLAGSITAKEDLDILPSYLLLFICQIGFNNHFEVFNSVTDLS